MRPILKCLVLLPLLQLLGCGTSRREPTRILMQTTRGDITLELSDLTPRHRDNFVRLTRQGHFDGVLFHRVIADFMIQGGDPDSRDAAPGTLLGNGDLGYTVAAEFRYPELLHRRGALAAARTSDEVNPRRASSSSQFYIVWGRTFTDPELDAVQQRLDRATGGRIVLSPSVREIYRTEGGTPHLDGQYTVFGRVVEGLDTVEAILNEQTDDNDRPLNDVRIVKASVLE